jgi:TetR/AcrR family transcriptional regulator, transcriptional repressor for nem operon
MPAAAAVDNRAQLLAAARALLQTRGFNAFSFRDLAQAVRIKSSSVHYHFPAKEDLGVALVRGYVAEVRDFFSGLEARQSLSAGQRIKAFMSLFEATAREDGQPLCLAGMLASDFVTLGEPLQAEVRGFFVMVERWLAAQIAVAGPSRSAEQSRRLARLALASLEGALLAARVFGDPARVRQANVQLLSLIEHPER